MTKGPSDDAGASGTGCHKDEKTGWIANLPHPNPVKQARYEMSLKTLSVAECKVMVVCSNGIELRMLAKIFTRFGYATKEAYGGPEAIIHTTRAHYHLVFSEFQLPELDGFELANRIKQHSPHTNIVLMTNRAPHEVAEWRSAAIDGWLFKPFKIIDLGNVVASLNLPNAFQACDWTERRPVA